MKRLLLVPILLAACYSYRSAKVFLDRAILLADKNLYQHQTHREQLFFPSLLDSSRTSRTTTTTTTMNGASSSRAQQESSSSPPASLTWFLHFHKAAGSSFTDLALKNKYTFRDANRDKHGHLELSVRQGEFRWELLGATGEEFVQVNNRTTCWLDHANKDEMEQEQARVLGQELSTLHQQGVSFVSTEHWFPSHKVLQQTWQQQNEQQPARLPTMVALLRDPVERILSSYTYHNRGGGRCSGTIGTKKKKRCDLEDWHKGEANMYVSMLNGIPFGPRKVGTACAPHMLNVGEQEYQSAVQSLDQNFQVVLTLDSIRNRPSQVACVLNKVLGWNEATFPQKNRNIKNTSYSSNIDSQLLHQIKDANAYDIQLYQHVQDMESRLFAQFGCNNDEDSKSYIRQE